MKRVLLTGANGFLGKHLSDQLLKNNFHLITTTRNNHKSSIKCDLTREQDVKALIEKTNPEIIVHCAAFVPKAFLDYNDSGFLVLNSSMLENIVAYSDAPIVYISSMTVYGQAGRIIFRESDAGNPDSLYGKSKFDGEMLLEKNKRNSLAVRIPGLFGVERETGLVFNTIKALINRTDLKLPEYSILWAAMSVKDAAKIIVDLIKKADFLRYTPVNIGYSGDYSINKFLAFCEEIFQTTINYEITHPQFKFDLSYLKFLKLMPKKSFKESLIEFKNLYERAHSS